MTTGPLEEHFRAHRRYLLGVAYRLLGSVTEADDALQEAWLRTRDADLDGVRDVRSWLTVIVTRICLDVLKSSRVQRERYIGEWLPEPIVDGADPADPADRVSLDDSVSLALLVVLERLSPAERTAFVLHEVFGLPFDTIAEAVGRSPAACRQLASRARRHVEADAPRFDADRDEHRRVVDAFANAAARGHLQDLLEVLDPDVVLRSDGGGKVPARREPLVSAPAVAALVLGIMRLRPGTRFRVATVNGAPGLLTYENGRLTGVVAFAVAAGRITELQLLMNPDKLQHVG
ncbi:RNA polymerase sigma factor SigJ [Egicoccus sp. AB-alg2]|uniref:RNA polymerase sigma factor SigJ n=1 Tax=Egicoccus sp. AB-alg2 TaxID=3242693 RepID=UPI00359CD20E